MFSLTTAAAAQIRQAAADSGAHDLALRVAARTEPDGSIAYGMGFDAPADSDMKLDLDGVAVLIAEPHQDLLDHTVLDYVELQPGAFHFIFIDPRLEADNAAAPAAGGCGSGACAGGGCAGKGALQ